MIRSARNIAARKKFLRDLRRAVKKLRCRAVLKDGVLRFFLGDGDKAKYCPTALVCAYRVGEFYPNDIVQATLRSGTPVRLRKQVDRAAYRYPSPPGYDRNLRKALMRAAGIWV